MLKVERGASPEMPLPPELQKLLDRKTLLLLLKGETGTRMKVEQSLMAVLEDTGARMVLVSEHPETNSTLDQLAEAILVLHQRVIDDRRVRELEFRKLRGVPIRQERYLFTLAGGRLRYLEPFAFTLPERTSMFRPLENTSTPMYTGSRDIDALLGGGVPRGSTVLLEIRGDVPFERPIY